MTDIAPAGWAPAPAAPRTGYAALHLAMVAAPLVLGVATLISILTLGGPFQSMNVIPTGVAFLLSFAARVPDLPLRRRRQGPGAVLAAGAILFLLAAMSIRIIFGETDIFAIFFHVVFGVGGMGVLAYAPQIGWAVVFVGVPALALWRLRGLVRAVPGGWALAALGLLAINPVLRDTATVVAMRTFGEGGTLVEEIADVPRPGAAAVAASGAGSPPNLVFLFVEGFDQLYTDPALFGDLAKPMRDLARDGLTFTQVGQAEATGWTTAGHASAWCGLPLPPKFDGFAPETEVLEAQTCLPNVLAAHGYEQAYFAGTAVSHKNHYGFDNFVSAREIGTVFDKPALLPRFETPERMQENRYWGLYDSEMLEEMEVEIDALAARGTPFAVYAKTVDTHGPDAQISPACTEDGVGRAEDGMEGAVSCVADLVAGFARRLHARYGDDLLIVVTSDHLAFRNNLTDRMEGRERRNFVTMLGGGLTPGVVEREGSMLDLFPTILDAMGHGAPGDRGGLGASLLGEAPTLVERFGREGLDRRLRFDGRLVSYIWP